MNKDIKNIIDKVDTSIYNELPFYKWREILNKECECYVFNEAYICKRFDQINYRFCSEEECERIVTDNIYALLRYKYFKEQSNENDNKIKDIVKMFCDNLKSTLIRASFDKDEECNIIEMLPNYCVAFRNGVYNFKDNNFLFKYDIINIDTLRNRIYHYDPKYVILWYININFEELPIDINKVSLNEFIYLFKEITKTNKNYCFELLYNMSHDSNNKFSMDIFNHLCEIMGFTLLQQFSQHFVMLVGEGQNGKNSLFDGCLTSKLIPSPSTNSLEEIEEDKFITGSLENRYHNIFLESSARTYKDSKMLKALTGSMYQTIQQKGINKYSGIINSKFIFSANDIEKLKFTDTTIGFKRRINVIELFYKRDSKDLYLKKGDYYNLRFSDDYSELKESNESTTMFVYFAMYGVKMATNNFTTNFKFTHNDYKNKYKELDVSLKEQLESLSLNDIVKWIEYSPIRKEEAKPLFYDIKNNRLYNSYSLHNYEVKDYDSFIKFLKNPELYNEYFIENDCYINLKILRKILNYDDNTSYSFSQNIKKIYSINEFVSLYNNQPYTKCTFKNGILQILK